MEKPKVYITRLIAQEALTPIKKACIVHIWPGANPPRLPLILWKI